MSGPKTTTAYNPCDTQPSDKRQLETKRGTGDDAHRTAIKYKAPKSDTAVIDTSTWPTKRVVAALRLAKTNFFENGTHERSTSGLYEM